MMEFNANWYRPFYGRSRQRLVFFTSFFFLAQMDLIGRLLIRVYSERIEAQNISFH